MAKFGRETVEGAKAFRRIEGDMRVTFGKADVTIKPMQVMAQDKTDGKFYNYVKGDANKGIIAGIYTGEEDLILTVAGEDAISSINSLIVAGKNDLVGVDLATDYTAITELKKAGVILVDKIDGEDM